MNTARNWSRPTRWMKKTKCLVNGLFFSLFLLLAFSFYSSSALFSLSFFICYPFIHLLTMKLLFVLLVSLALLHCCHCYTVNIKDSSSTYYYSTVLYSDGAYSRTSSHYYTFHNSPSTIRMGYMNSGCVSCHPCFGYQNTAIPSSYLSISITYYSSYYTVSGTMNSLVCKDSCSTSKLNSQNYQYGIPQNAYVGSVTLVLTVNP